MDKLRFLTRSDYIKNEDAICDSIISDILLKGDVAIGTDVEVLWLQTSKLMDETVLHKFYSADNTFVKQGIYGTDGRTQQGEWRISPAYDVAHFKTLTEKVLTLCKTYTLLRQRKDPQRMPNIAPFGMGVFSFLEQEELQIHESIGLHIHIGNPCIREGTKHHDCVAAFDAFLAPIIRLFEPEINYHNRTNCGFYGTLSDNEKKAYGLEYKTLPSCIDDPDVFIGVFAIAKALAFEIVNDKIDTVKIKPFKIKTDYIKNRYYLKKMAKQAQIFIKNNCRFYYVYKEEIDKLFEKAFSKNSLEYFETGEDIFSLWDIEFDVENPKIIETFNNGTILLPLTTPICGYNHPKLAEQFGKPLDIESSSPFKTYRF